MPATPEAMHCSMEFSGATSCELTAFAIQNSGYVVLASIASTLESRQLL